MKNLVLALVGLMSTSAFANVYDCKFKVDGKSAKASLDFSGIAEAVKVSMEDNEYDLKFSRKTEKNRFFGDYEYDGYGGSVELMIPRNFSMYGSDRTVDFSAELTIKTYSEAGFISQEIFKGKCERNYLLPKALGVAVEKLISECSGNDSGSVGKFDVKTFSSAEVMKNLKKDQNNEEGSCRSTFSRTKAEAVKSTLSRIFDTDEYSCVKDAVTEKEQNLIRKMIQDPTNLGVFAKEWDGESGDSEYCMYYNYDIYRADGTVISIVFNHTD